MIRSSSPASRTRSVASSCWALEIVVVVTRQPVVRAAWIAIPPQPVPISSRWVSGPSWRRSQMRSSFASCASSRLASSRGKYAQEYIIVGSRKLEKRSLPRS